MFSREKEHASPQHSRGVSEASGGNFQQSASGHPQVVLTAFGSGGHGTSAAEIPRYFRLSAYDWSDTAFSVAMPPATGNPPGYYLLWAIVNGIPSQGRIVKLE